MIRLFKKLFRWMFIWVLLPSILFYLVLWIVRPEKYLMEHISTELTTQAGIRLDYSDVRLLFPWTLRLTDLQVSQHEEKKHIIDSAEITLGKRHYFNADVIEIKVCLRPLLDRKASLKFHGKSYAGQFNGMIQTDIQPDPGPMMIELRWESIDLALLATDYPNMQIQKGTTAGEADLMADYTKRFSYAGPVKLTIDDCAIHPPQQLDGQMNMPLIHKVSADLNLNFEEISIESAWFYSRDTNARVSGVVNQKLPADQTRIDLNIRLYMFSEQQPFQEDMYFPIQVKGTVKDPQVLFLGRELKSSRKMPL